MAKKAKTRRTWTAEHIRTLKKMARQRKRASHIAKALKRTEGATRQKAFSMGISLDSARLVLVFLFPERGSQIDSRVARRVAALEITRWFDYLSR